MGRAANAKPNHQVEGTLTQESNRKGAAMTEPEESESSGWELALFHHLTKFKNDLETALLDAHNFQALRLRVRDIHSGLVATVRAFAKILGGEKDHADDDDEGISPLHRDEGSDQGC